MPPSMKALQLISQHIDDMWRIAKNVDEISSFAPYVVAADEFSRYKQFGKKTI